jgi:hypothetical protein
LHVFIYVTIFYMASNRNGLYRYTALFFYKNLLKRGFLSSPVGAISYLCSLPLPTHRCYSRFLLIYFFTKSVL